MKDKITLITGGASGMGKAAVKAFSERESKVIFCDVQDEKGQALAEELAGQGRSVEYYHCDLFQISEIETMFQHIKDKYGRLDFAINNAGFGHNPKPMAELSADEVTRIFNINAVANARLMIQELRIMEPQGFGRIVVTTSGAGLLGSKFYSIYSASKHAICGMVKSAALEYAEKGITINAIAPGTIGTEMMEAMKERDPASYAACCRSNPANRLGRPEEIASAMVFLCEENSAFINGVILPVDSGFCAGK